MSEHLISKEKQNQFERRLGKLDPHYNTPENCIYILHITERNYKKFIDKIENTGDKLGIRDFIEIGEPRKDHMRGGYLVRIVIK